MKTFTSRRNFLMTSAGIAGLAASGLSAQQPTEQEPEQDEEEKEKERKKIPLPVKKYDLKLGIASYSFREFSRPLALRLAKQMGTPYINVKDVHLPVNMSEKDLKKALAQFDKAGLTIVGGGTIKMEKDEDVDIRRSFEYAKTRHMPLMVIAPTKQTMPRIEKFVKEYDIKVAIHNHGPEDKHFPSPYDVLEVVRSMDPRVGLCMDCGHATRAGADIVKAAADAGDRLLDMHIKDLADPKLKNSQCDVGDGVLPIVALFKQLKKMNYRGYVNLEYEINSYDPVPGMLKSFSYMRGVLDVLRG